MGRIPMGASDYAIMRYTEDETANDTSLTSFSISRDMMYLIPYIKAAQALNSNIHFWASPWTPPTWMKTFSGLVNGATCAMQGTSVFDGGCMDASAANLTAYAQYFVKFVQAYAAQNIPIEFVAPQNEPNYALGYPSCLWNSADYTKFVGEYLGPALGSTSTKLMLGTNSNNTSGKDTAVVTSVMGDATAKTFPKVIGLQWGMLDNYESSSSMYKTYGIPVWATEHMCGNYPWNPSGFPSYVDTAAPNDLAYGVESWGYIAKAIRAGVTAYNAWNMVLDTVGKGNDSTRAWAQNALLTVNTSTKTLNITPAYYVFRHFSQFVQPGATVLATTGGDAVGFKNPDGTLVGVMYNSGSATTYTVAIGGKKLQFPMPAKGWATVLLSPGT
jgi:glucosylceramidase